MRSVRVSAPAKINLFLRVLGRRDDGYHDLETLFQAIDLYDEMIIRESTGESSIVVSGFPALETEDNLVMKALRWLENRVQERLVVTIELVKRIPVAAGLGGGSSDAAAALMGMQALFDLDLDHNDLQRAAVELGADVPFFLLGGTAVGEGVGERLTPVRLSLDFGVLLVNPGFQVSTGPVFREFSKTLTGERREGRLWEILWQTRDLERLLHNDLEGVAEGLHPEIARLRATMERAGIRKALMTGSGPTVFGIADLNRLEEISARVSGKWKPIVSRPVPNGVVVD